MIQIKKISSKFEVRKLDISDVDDVFVLCSKNVLYYQYCPPFITREGVIEDMTGLPPGKTINDKYFLGYYKNKKLVAIIDLISGYPNDKTAYIGLFMVDIDAQGEGIGTLIIEELSNYMKIIGFEILELAWVKGNPQAESFWLKNKFRPIGERRSNIAKPVIAAERKL